MTPTFSPASSGNAQSIKLETIETWGVQTTWCWTMMKPKSSLSMCHAEIADLPELYATAQVTSLTVLDVWTRTWHHQFMHADSLRWEFCSPSVCMTSLYKQFTVLSTSPSNFTLRVLGGDSRRRPIGNNLKLSRVVPNGAASVRWTPHNLKDK